ncbi:MAG TPA: BatA and WFA domain-containing protein [Vicinamibacterales bacterium]|nr:BatA and WFA domain-containing protein [Vicinamibacterales bacterium]
MSFLTPLFLLGLAALAVPVLIHLTQRERKSVVEFPSLMFLRKIPYESVQRRRIRDWLLLAMRLGAIALIVLAFARPFLRGSQVAAAAGGARDIVVLLDRSYSMGYGDSWTRAQRAAAAALESATPADRISLVLFADTAEVALRSTPDRSRAVAEINAATPGPGSTKYAPALKLAGSLLAESLLPRKEIIIVSDFQRGGWQPDDTLRMPGGTTITTAVVEGAQGANLALTPVALLRSREAGQPERVTVTAGMINRTATAANDVTIQLEIDGRVVQDLKISAAPNASATVSFAPLTITAPNTRAVVRLGASPQAAVDALTRDNVFNFTITPAAPVPVLAVSQGSADGTLYLARALSIGESPRFAASMQSPEALTESMNRARVIILNDLAIGDAAAAKLVTFVEGGGGLMIAMGPRTSWPASRAAWLPASIGPPVDRTRGAARLSGMDYGHAIFEPFRAPRSGDFSTARFYSYRALGAAKDASVLARFDTGEPALVERAAGRGRVLLYASTLDLSWNDLALKPMFLPFVHQLGRHLSGFREQPSWLTIGQVLDIDAAEVAAGATSGSAIRGAEGRAILTPSGQRRDLPVPVAAPGATAPPAAALELNEQGFYEIRGSGRDAGPMIVAASNVSLAESNLDRMDPKELVAAMTGNGATGSTPSQDVLPDEAQELAQRVWWYLLFAGILLLIAETVLAHRLSRRSIHG